MQTLFTRNVRPSNAPNRVAEIQSVLIAVVLLGLTLALRFAPLPENFSAFGALAVFCGLYTFGAFRWWFPVASLFLADCIGHFSRIPGMGFYHLPSMALNYLGFAVMALVAARMSNWSVLQNRMSPSAISGTAMVAMISSACFFLISNFGAWLDPMMQYEKSPAGLLNCYFAGLPFWRSSLMSDVLFSVGFSMFAMMMVPVFSQLSTVKNRSQS